MMYSTLIATPERQNGASQVVTQNPAFSSSMTGGAKALGLLWRIYRRAREEAQIRLAICELDGLDDRTLKDIGFYRNEIEYRVRHGRGQRR